MVISPLLFYNPSPKLGTKSCRGFLKFPLLHLLHVLSDLKSTIVMIKHYREKHYFPTQELSEESISFTVCQQ